MGPSRRFGARPIEMTQRSAASVRMSCRQVTSPNANGNYYINYHSHYLAAYCHSKRGTGHELEADDMRRAARVASITKLTMEVVDGDKR